MESWITLFTAHGKAKDQLSHVLQTELSTIPKDSQLYTFPQCRLRRNHPHSYILVILICNNADVIRIFFAALVLLTPLVLTQWHYFQTAIYNQQPILRQHGLFPCRLSRRLLKMFSIHLQANIHFHSV